jgi:hypothetical protein
MFRRLVFAALDNAAHLPMLALAALPLEQADD